jgi:PHP family Zn ribbon phosphoesterase
MLADFRADLHVHTCLSPCASDTMLPRIMVAAAVSKQLNIVAVCDHNAADNVHAVRQAAEGQALTVIGGVEITSREEVHILGLFDNDQALSEINALIERHLPGRNDEEAFGEQWVVDTDGGITGISHRLLIGATSLSVEQVVEAIHHLEGLAIASHIDREAFGIIGQLGFIPSGLQLDALELSSAAVTRRDSYSRQYDLPLITSSDAHYPGDIGNSATTFTMATVSIAEMRKALRGEDGRKIMME